MLRSPVRRVFILLGAYEDLTERETSALRRGDVTHAIALEHRKRRIAEAMAAARRTAELSAEELDALTRRVRFLEGGVCYFPPDPSRYRGLRIQPRVSRLAKEGDVLAGLVAGAGRRGLGVGSWTVYLHVDWMDEELAGVCERNAFGDPKLTDARSHVEQLQYAISGLSQLAVHQAIEVCCRRLPLARHVGGEL